MKTYNSVDLRFFAIWTFGVLIMAACSRQNDRDMALNMQTEATAQNIEKQPVITFDTLYHDFGTIIEGEMVVCYFDYENSGGSSLIIRSVEATCGCTTPDWTRTPLAPGKKEKLKIIFDASGRSGAQRKVITVKSNATNPAITLTLIAHVNDNV